jgi:hypothetical protein
VLSAVFDRSLSPPLANSMLLAETFSILGDNAAALLGTAGLCAEFMIMPENETAHLD